MLIDIETYRLSTYLLSNTIIYFFFRWNVNQLLFFCHSIFGIGTILWFKAGLKTLLVNYKFISHFLQIYKFAFIWIWGALSLWYFILSSSRIVPRWYFRHAFLKLKYISSFVFNILFSIFRFVVPVLRLRCSWNYENFLFLFLCFVVLGIMRTFKSNSKQECN